MEVCWDRSTVVLKWRGTLDRQGSEKRWGRVGVRRGQLRGRARREGSGRCKTCWRWRSGCLSSLPFCVSIRVFNCLFFILSMRISLYFCPSVDSACLHVCNLSAFSLTLHMSADLSLCDCMPISQFICLHVGLSACLYICMHVYRSSSLSVCT